LAEASTSTASITAGSLAGFTLSNCPRPIGAALPSFFCALVDTSAFSPAVPVFPHHFAVIVTLFLNYYLINSVILSEVRRQPNEVEGPHVCRRHPRLIQLFHHGTVEISPRSVLVIVFLHRKSELHPRADYIDIHEYRHASI
jgi:hypothetical protein